MLLTFPVLARLHHLYIHGKTYFVLRGLLSNLIIAYKLRSLPSNPDLFPNSIMYTNIDIESRVAAWLLIIQALMIPLLPPAIDTTLTSYLQIPSNSHIYNFALFSLTLSFSSNHLLANSTAASYP